MTRKVRANFIEIFFGNIKGYMLVPGYFSNLKNEFS